VCRWSNDQILLKLDFFYCMQLYMLRLLLLLLSSSLLFLLLLITIISFLLERAYYLSMPTLTICVYIKPVECNQPTVSHHYRVWNCWLINNTCWCWFSSWVFTPCGLRQCCQGFGDTRCLLQGRNAENGWVFVLNKRKSGGWYPSGPIGPVNSESCGPVWGPRLILCTVSSKFFIQ
jgi:hypothetical protein